MMRQCGGCGTALTPKGRSPFCPQCWLKHQKMRNREKVRAHRQRARSATPARSESPPQPHLPTEVDLSWLDWMDPDVGAAIRRAVELLNQGRGTDDPEVSELALLALRRYDTIRDAIEARARTQEGGDRQTTSWRGFFESVRRTLA